MLTQYQDLAAHLAAALPELPWIDRDKGQLQSPEAFHSIMLPGLLLGFGEVAWEGLSMGNQLGILTLTASLVFRLPPSTYQKQPITDYGQMAQLTTQVHRALTAFSADVVESAGRVNDRLTSRDYFTDNFYVIEMTYDMNVHYCKPINTIPRPAPDIEATIELPLLP